MRSPERLEKQGIRPRHDIHFKDGEVEVLEVLQEEVDNIDHEAVKKQVAAAEDAKFQKHRKQRQRRKQSASKGSRYQRKYF